MSSSSDSLENVSGEEACSSGVNFQDVMAQLRKTTAENSKQDGVTDSVDDGDAAEPRPSTSCFSVESESTSRAPENDAAAEDDDGESVESSIDRLFERHRRDIMFELRRMNMGIRPVTGQGHREVIGTFLRRATSNDASNEPYEPRHRPEEVMVEVQGLVERRPVSSLLHSFQFRQSLESTLRGSLSRVPTVRQSTPSVAAGSTSQASPDLSVHNSSVSLPQAVNEQPQHQEAPVPDLPVTNSTERAAQWLDQQTEPTESPSAEVPQHHNVWATLGDSTREDLLNEISELVQHQLVTSTLQGNFRNTLERRVLDHVQNTGGNGGRVAQFIRNIPQSTVHVRNDFSNLGLPQAPMAPEQSISDDISVISATAAVRVVQNQQIPAAVSREMRAMRTQIEELRNMVARSFDLQLDIQRAIRQEVSAAVNQAMSTNQASGSSEPAAGNRCQHSTYSSTTRPSSDSSRCLICLDNSTDCVLYQCGHVCVCYGCGMTLKSRGDHCPVCRAPIRDIIRAYYSNSHE